MTIHSAPNPSKFNVTLHHLRARGQRFIEPAASIQDLGTRRQVQLQTALILVLITLTLVAAIVTTPIQAQGMKVQTLGLFGAVVLLSIAYGLSRTRHFEWGAILAVTLLSLVGFLTALANPASAGTILYAYIPIAFVLGGFLLRTRYAAALVVIDTLCIFCLPLIIGDSFAFRQAAAEGGVLLTLGMLLIVFSIVRNLTEQDRLAVVTKANEDLQALRETLEQRVIDRTAQLQASAEVGRAATSILDADELLRAAVNLITDRFGFYYTAIFTLDETEHWAELREATGEAGRALKEQQHRLEVGGQSMVGTAIATRQARIALDTGVEAVRFANPLLPATRSEIALPLVVGDRVLGALDVQSTQVAAFDESNAAVLQTMADQLAIALSNAEQFKQTDATLQNTHNLFAASHEISTATDSDDLLRTLIGHITPDASRAGIVLFGPRDETGHPAYFEFVTTWVHADFAATTQIIQPGARFTSQQLPVVSSVTPAQPLVVPDAGADAVPSGLRTFMHGFGAEAMIALALVAGHHPLGALIIGYRHARTFSDDYLQTLVTLGGQAAVVIQNQRALVETQAALKQLDLVNRRLTGEAWRAYAAALGGALRVRDVMPGFQDETMPTALDAPIVVRGEAIGTLSLEDAAPDRVWTPDEIALLQAVAGEVAVAVENARLIEQTERRAQREHIVAEISNEMFAANDIESILRSAGDELGRVLRLSRVAVRLRNEYNATGAEVSRSQTE